jgi:acetyl esterase/lipase
MASKPIDLMSRLDDDHQGVLEVLPEGLLDLSDIVKTREGLAALLGAMPAPELPEGVTVEDRLVPGFDGDPLNPAPGGHEVLVRLYRPADLAPDAPALYWIHGGGMVLGSVEMNDLECAVWAAELGCTVASVDYRLAPEHPFPAAINDCYAGLAWLAANAADLGIDADRIAIGGASAGGGLATGTALLARDRSGPALCFQLLVFPMVDHRNITDSSHAIVDSRVWNRDANLAAWAAYLSGSATGPGDAPVSPYASPSVAPDLAGLPPAYINVGEFDMFLDEDVAYARALMAAGVPAELRVYPGAFHGSTSMVAHSPLSQRWVADQDDALRRGLGLDD